MAGELLAQLCFGLPTVFGLGFLATGAFFSGTSQMTLFQRGSYSLRIGGNTNFFFHGIIDEFRVWSIARSQSQIQSSMNLLLTGAEPNLLLYYRFD